jgi:hypothetical protein
MKSFAMIVGRSIQVWVDGAPIQLGDALEETNGWRFDNPTVSHVCLPFTVLEFFEGDNPDELIIESNGGTHHMVVDVVLSPQGTVNVFLHGDKVTIDENDTLISAHAQGSPDNKLKLG